MKCPACRSDNPSESRFCGKCGATIDGTSPTLSYSPAEEATVRETLKLNPGDAFGERYTIIEEIGEGGMGRLYKAADRELGITVVLKMIRPDLSSRPGMIDQIRKETLLGRSVSHENVVRIHDLGEINKIKYISMDFIKGENLLELIRASGTLSLATCLQIAIQVCQALKAAHQKGIIHQDVKPQNIMIDYSGRIFVTDFGLARSLSASAGRRSDASYGTPKYFSPEQAQGQASDERSDIYSLGAVLYEMTTGAPPFKADTVEGYIQKHVAEKPVPPSRINADIPPACDKIILKCLEKAKEDRYQTVGDLLRDLEIQKLQGHVASGASGLKKWQKAGLGAALTVLLGAAVYRLFIRPAPPPSGRIPLAVMYAVNNSGDRSLDDQIRWPIPYLLTVDLAQSKYLSVLPQDRLMQILQDAGQMDEAHHMSKTLDRIANAANIAYFILPSLTKVGDGYWFSVTIRKAKTDEALGEPDIVKGKGSEDFFAMVSEMSMKVKSRLSLSSREIAADTKPDLGRIATTSLEAMRHYIDGEIAYVRSDYEASIRSLAEAVKEDPNFAMAYLKLAIDSEYVGDYGRIKPYLEKALALADRVGERERYLIRGHASYSLEPSPLKAIEIYQKLIALYPQDVEGRIALGSIRRNLEEWDLALEQFDKILSLDHMNPLALENNVFIYTAKGLYERAIGLCEGGLTIAPEVGFFTRQMPLLYLIQGQYDRASAELQKARTRKPDSFLIQELEGNLCHLQGDWPAARRIYEQLQRRGEATPGALDLRGRYWLTQLQLELGEFRQAHEGILEGLELARTGHRPGDEIDYRLLLGSLEIRNGRFSRAADALRPALELARKNIEIGAQKSVLHLLGLASLGMGRLDEARQHGDELRLSIERASFAKEMRRYHHLMGHIALAEGRPGEAVRLFEQAVSLLPSQREYVDEHAFYENSLAQAYEQDGSSSRALETYRKIVALTTGRLQWGDIYARSFYRIGRILQRNGRGAEAFPAYERFVELWKDADAGLPEVDDARKQLEALKKLP